MTLDQKMHKENMFAEFATPSWAATITYGQITKFTDLELACMKYFIDDELSARAKAKVAS